MTVVVTPFADGFFTTGVTPVELLPSPPADTTYTVLCLRYRNEDSIAHGYILERVIGSDRFVMDRVAAGSIDAGGGALVSIKDRIIIIDGLTTTLEFSLTEAIGSAEGHVSIEVLDRTVS